MLCLICPRLPHFQLFHWCYWDETSLVSKISLGFFLRSKPHSVGVGASVHEQMIYFVWKLDQVLLTFTDHSLSPFLSSTHALNIIILKNVCLIEEVNWYCQPKFSQIHAKILWSTSYIPVTWANDVTDWRFKLGISGRNSTSYHM